MVFIAESSVFIAVKCVVFVAVVVSASYFGAIAGVATMRYVRDSSGRDLPSQLFRRFNSHVPQVLNTIKHRLDNSDRHPKRHI